jgi:hypothetical protein
MAGRTEKSGPLLFALGREPTREDLELSRGLAELGGYPDGRLRWLTKVIAENPGEWSDDQWAVRRSQLHYLAEGSGASVSGVGAASPLTWVIPSAEHRQEIVDALEEIRRCLLNLASQRLHESTVPTGAFVFCITETGIDRRFLGPLYAALVHAGVDLLAAAGPLRLRFCPYVPEGASTPCARVFLAKRRQKFCTTSHARAAAWSAYIKRLGGTRAKDPLRPQRKSRR